jgi:hypothetical protein
VQVWAIGGWHWWWGGASFGQRFFIASIPLWALGLADGEATPLPDSAYDR